MSFSAAGGRPSFWERPSHALLDREDPRRGPCVVTRPRPARTVNQRLLLLALWDRPIQVHFLDNRNFSPLAPFAAARNQEGGCDE
jgi:hypothetical protein